MAHPGRDEVFVLTHPLRLLALQGVLSYLPRATLSGCRDRREWFHALHCQEEVPRAHARHRYSCWGEKGIDPECLQGTCTHDSYGSSLPLDCFRLLRPVPWPCSCPGTGTHARAANSRRVGSSRDIRFRPVSGHSKDRIHARWLRQGRHQHSHDSCEGHIRAPLLPEQHRCTRSSIHLGLLRHFSQRGHQAKDLGSSLVLRFHRRSHPGTRRENTRSGLSGAGNRNLSRLSIPPFPTSVSTRLPW